MSIVLDGTRGISASGGLYAANTFTGTYTGGVVVDYTSGKGRISVGSGDGLTIYNNGVANNALVTLDVYGRFTVNGGDNNGLWPSTAPGLYFQRTQASSESNIPFIRAESDATTTNLLIGSSSSGGVVKFITGSSLLERMRIDANGNLLVGTTSSSVNARAAITQPNDIYYCLNLENTTTGSTPLGIRVKYTASGPNNAGAVFLTAADNSATRFELRSNGGLANFSANNLNLSDERVKTDITPAPSWLAKINAIEVVNFKYKDQTHEDPNLGVIAQQVLSVAPELVDEEGFGETPEDGVPLMAIFETDLKYAMLKAIQELTARLESSEAKNTELENRIAALENK